MLTQINVVDFMPFAEAIFLPDDEALLLVMGENGAGKSALFEAIHWCVTGVTVRGLAQGVIRHGAKSCEVSTCWQLDDGFVTITRYKSKSENRVEIEVDDDEPEVYTAADAQSRIEELLGDLSMLALVGFFGRKFKTFSDMSPRDRADLIDVLARASVWEDFRSEAASDVSIYRRDLKQISGELEHSEGNLERQLDALAEAEENLADAKKKQKAGLVELRKDEKGFRAELADVEQQLERGEKSLAKLEKNQRGSQKIIETFGVDITTARTEIARLEAEQRHYELPDAAECPTCGQRITKKLRDELGVEADKIGAQLEQLDEQVVKLERDKKKRQDNAHEVGNEISLLMRSEREWRRDELQSKDALASVRTRIERLKSNEDVTRYTERVTILKGPEGVPMWKKKVKDARVSLKATEEGLQCAEFWAVGFKQIRYMAMGRVADLLSTLMSRSVKALGFDVDELTCTIWREGQRKGATRPEVNILVRRGEYEDPIEALSEGETARVDLACFIAIGQLVRAIEGFDPGFRVLDEPLVGMDEAGKHRTFQLLAETLEGQRFVIDHDGHFQDLFRDSMIVERNDEDLAELRSL